MAEKEKKGRKELVLGSGIPKGGKKIPRRWTRHLRLRPRRKKIEGLKASCKKKKKRERKKGKRPKK